MSLPDMPSANWESQLPLFWHYVRWFLEENQVWIMIGIAIMLATVLLQVIANLFIKDKDDEDDGYDYKEF